MTIGIHVPCPGATRAVLSETARHSTGAKLNRLAYDHRGIENRARRRRGCEKHATAGRCCLDHREPRNPILIPVMIGSSLPQLCRRRSDHTQDHEVPDDLINRLGALSIEANADKAEDPLSPS